MRTLLRYETSPSEGLVFRPSTRANMLATRMVWCRCEMVLLT